MSSFIHLFMQQKLKQNWKFLLAKAKWEHYRIIFWEFIAQKYPFWDNDVISQIENFSQTDLSKCTNFITKPEVKTQFWTLYFNGSKPNDGAWVGCIIVIPEGDNIMLSFILQFECTNNTAKYEALIQGLYKAISLDVKYLWVFGGS